MPKSERVRRPARGDRDEIQASPAGEREWAPDFYEGWQRYFDLYNFAPVTYIRLDQNGVVEEVNQAGCQMLDSLPGAILGHPLLGFVSQDSRIDFLEHMRRCRATDSVVETEMSLRARNGKALRVRALTKRSHAMARAAYWTILFDLTEQHRLTQAREHAEDERARAENEKRLGRLANEATHRFLNVLSHELRTPLTPALFAASRLLEHDMPERARRLGEVIRRNIQSEARLIDDLLDVSRIERGALDLSRSAIDVHEVIREALEGCRSHSAGKPLALESRLEASRHFVYGDPGRLRQVMSNLLTNAIKFTDHGSVEVRTSNDESGGIHITVRDTGIGLDTGRLNGLFKSFEQHRTDSSRGGLGLGLAICRGVVEAHNGHIWASSEGEGRGSTFEVELPTTDTPHVAEQPVGAAAGSREDASRRMRILVVEDDDDTAAILKDLLGQEGHALDVVHSVREARRPVDEPWDIVISDLGLPDGSGFDVARHFSRLTPRPRLIALSGYGSESDLDATNAAGFERHLVKPIDLGQLRRALTISASA
jgi:hypothetical protein